MLNLILILAVILGAVFLLIRFIKKRQSEEVEPTLEIDDKTYTLDKMKEFVKKRLDEITKINLYDIGLSEEELKRRKQKNPQRNNSSYLENWRLTSVSMLPVIKNIYLIQF